MINRALLLMPADGTRWSVNLHWSLPRKSVASSDGSKTGTGENHPEVPEGGLRSTATVPGSDLLRARSSPIEDNFGTQVDTKQNYLDSSGDMGQIPAKKSSNQLRRVVENRATERRDFGNPDTIVIHVGTNDIKRSRNLDYVMGDIYDVINTAKSKFSSSRMISSGVLRSDVSWRRIGAANDGLGVTFLDPNSWVEDWYFKGDGLHLNRRGAQHLGQLFERVCGVGDGGHERGK